MLWESLRSARDLGRLHEIGSALIRYGFGDVVQRLGLTHFLERAGRALHWKDFETIAQLSTPQRICRAFEELGPSYIKLGQLLATRIDLFPPEWITEFERLQDEAPPVSFETLRPQLEEDLGAPVEDVFPSVDRTPLGAASLAQVHHARLADGAQVILKIRRPDIEESIEADLRLLNRLADIAENRLEEARRYNVKEIARQFTLSMRREMDFASEGRNAERIAASFADNPHIVIPKVYWQWTSKRLNVQQYLSGIRGRDVAAAEAAGLDRTLLARRGAEAVLTMTMVDGFFHADPHLGNFFFLPNNTLGLIDFGMVGRLSEPRREQIVDLVYALVTRDCNGVVDVLLDWAEDVSIDSDKLAVEIDAFLDHYHGVPLKRLDFSALLMDLIALLRDHQLVLPPDLTLLFKAFITLEGVGRRLDPDFDIVKVAEPFLNRLVAERYLPTSVLKRGARQSREVWEIVRGLPTDLRRVLRLARRGAFQLHVDLSRLDDFGNQLDKAASRMTVGLVTSAIIVGSSIIMTVQPEGGDTVFGMPLFGFLGFFGACLGGIWLLFSIWRSGKR